MPQAPQPALGSPKLPQSSPTTSRKSRLLTSARLLLSAGQFPGCFLAEGTGSTHKSAPNPQGGRGQETWDRTENLAALRGCEMKSPFVTCRDCGVSPLPCSHLCRSWAAPLGAHQCPQRTPSATFGDGEDSRATAGNPSGEGGAKEAAELLRLLCPSP